jgi:hypothetical protein
VCYCANQNLSRCRVIHAYQGRFIQPDTIVPDPTNPQSLNRYAYTGNNPLRFSDPTGHWAEDQLAAALGDDWHTRYFGKGGVFEGRDKLQDFMTSKNTKCPYILNEVSKFFAEAQVAHAAGVDFQNIDAIGARISATGGTGFFGGGSGDAVLNLTSGELSLFLSGEAGVTVGESLTAAGGLTVIKNLPSNEAFRAGFWSLGVAGGAGLGGNAELFWSAPMSDNYNVFDKAHGGFAGAGLAITGVGAYITQSYSWGVYREDASGVHLYAPPNPLTVAEESIISIAHDLALNPNLPWGPDR